MKKIFITVLIALGVLLLLHLAVIVIVYNIRLHQMWDQFDASVMPDETHTSWETEDGFLSYYNEGLTSKVEEGLSGRKHTIHYHKCTGTVSVDGETFNVDIWFSQEGAPRLHMSLAEEGEETQTKTNAECIETWVATDFYETDNEIIFILEVEETTYYKVGQEIKLIYKKK